MFTRITDGYEELPLKSNEEVFILDVYGYSNGVFSYWILRKFFSHDIAKLLWQKLLCKSGEILITLWLVRIIGSTVMMTASIEIPQSIDGVIKINPSNLAIASRIMPSKEISFPLQLGDNLIATLKLQTNGFFGIKLLHKTDLKPFKTMLYIPYNVS